MTSRELKPGRKYIVVVGWRTSFIRWCQHNEVSKLNTAIHHVTESYQLRGYEPEEIEIVMLRGSDRMPKYTSDLVHEYARRGALVSYEDLVDYQGLNPV